MHEFALALITKLSLLLYGKQVRQRVDDVGSHAPPGVVVGHRRGGQTPAVYRAPEILRQRLNASGPHNMHRPSWRVDTFPGAPNKVDLLPTSRSHQFHSISSLSPRDRRTKSLQSMIVEREVHDDSGACSSCSSSSSSDRKAIRVFLQMDMDGT